MAPFYLENRVQEAAKSRDKDTEASSMQVANERSAKLASELTAAKLEADQSQMRCEALQADLKGATLQAPFGILQLLCTYWIGLVGFSHEDTTMTVSGMCPTFCSD